MLFRPSRGRTRLVRASLRRDFSAMNGSWRTTAVRTPDERFVALPGYDFQPQFTHLAGFEQLRCHYIDVGPKDARDTFLCIHGQPCWSYLYRKMIPVLVESGARVIAPDLFGFGRSDKPVDEAIYTFSFHRNTLLAFLDRVAPASNLTLVCQDWGGILGLTLPMEDPGRFSRLLLMNTMLGTGDEPLPAGFIAWRQFCRDKPDFAPSRLLARACPQLSSAEASAYDAPFPSNEFRAGVRAFPELVPERADAEGAAISRAAREFLRSEWAGRAFMAIGMEDPVLGPAVMRGLHANVRGCPPPLELSGAGHFVQEWGDVVARAALDEWAE